MKKLKMWDASPAFRAQRMYDYFGNERVLSREDYDQTLTTKLERRVEEWRARLQKMTFMKKAERRIEMTRKLAKLAFDGGRGAWHDETSDDGDVT